MPREDIDWSDELNAVKQSIVSVWEDLKRVVGELEQEVLKGADGFPTPAARARKGMKLLVERVKVLKADLLTMKKSVVAQRREKKKKSAA